MTTISAALITQQCLAGSLTKNRENTLALAKEAAEKGAKIAVFPEMNLTGYLTSDKIKTISHPVDDQLILPFVKLSEQKGITLLIGLAERTSANRIYAAHLVIRPDETVRSYRKIHTSPFEQKFFSAGNRINLFKTGDICFGIQLCYDAHFPELTQAMALKGADIIFIPHASPRGTCREKYESWIRHMRARAFDNGVYIAACNQACDNGQGLDFPGISVFIGPDGNVLSRTLDGRAGIHMIEINTEALRQIRTHQMRYFLPNRRSDLFGTPGESQPS